MSILHLFTDLKNAKKGIPKHVRNETNRLKNKLKKQIAEVEKVLAQKLDDLQKRVDSREQTQTEIKKQESNLQWMNGIINRVNDLINY